MVSEDLARRTFAPLETNEGSFLSYVHDNVRWTLTGRNGPLAGTYIGKADITSRLWAPLYEKIDGALTAKIVNLLVSGNWVIVECKVAGKTKKGSIYEQELCWVCRYEGDKIVEVREYLDSLAVKNVLDE
jgi:uncharacterized protein